MPLSYAAICGRQDFEHKTISELDQQTNMLVMICAYADYYGCLSYILPIIIDILLDTKHGWTIVSYHPLRFVALGKKLRSPVLYFESLRFLISQCKKEKDWDEIGDVLGVTNEEAQSRFKQYVQEQHATMAKVQDDLVRLQLTDCFIVRDRERKDIATTFWNSLIVKKKNRSDYAKARERYNFIARSSYGQWLTQQLIGEEACLSTRRAQWATSLGGLECVLRNLSAAALWKSPAKIFGHRVVPKMSSMFKLGKKYDSEKYVRQYHEAIIKEAADIIDDAFKHREVELADGTVVVKKRCEYDNHADHFAYLPLDESHIPWEDEIDWLEVGELPAVSMKKASEDTLNMMGLISEEAEEVDENDQRPAWETDENRIEALDWNVEVSPEPWWRYFDARERRVALTPPYEFRLFAALLFFTCAAIN